MHSLLRYHLALAGEVYLSKAPNKSTGNGRLLISERLDLQALFIEKP